MTRKPSTKYYQKNKEKIEKTSGEKYRILTEEERNKRKYKVVNDVEISQKMKNKS